MAKPSSKVLVINDEPLILRELLKGLNSAARSLDNPFGISFIGALTAKEGLALIERDGDIQTAIVDDKLYAVSDGRANGKPTRKSGDGRRNLQVSALKLVQKITSLRPELDIYILIEKEKEDQVVDALFTEAVDGYFYREERDYRGMYRILNAQIAERARTPFYDRKSVCDGQRRTRGTRRATRAAIRCVAAPGPTSSMTSWASTCSTRTYRCRSRHLIR